MLDSEQPDNTDAPNLPRVSTGAEEEKLKIGQAPHHPLQLSGLGAHKLELFYMNQGAPNWAMQGGSEILGCCFTLPSVAASGQSTGPRYRQALVLV